MPSISQYSLIFPCRNIALPTFVPLSLFLFYGISALLFIFVSIFLAMYASIDIWQTAAFSTFIFRS